MGPLTHPVSKNYASQHLCLCTHPILDFRFRGNDAELVILDECRRRRDGIGFLTTGDGCVCFTWAEPQVPFAPGGGSSDRLRHRLIRRGIAWPLLWPAREPNEGHR